MIIRCELFVAAVCHHIYILYTRTIFEWTQETFPFYSYSTSNIFTICFRLILFHFAPSPLSTIFSNGERLAYTKLHRLHDWDFVCDWFGGVNLLNTKNVGE